MKRAAILLLLVCLAACLTTQNPLFRGGASTPSPAPDTLEARQEAGAAAQAKQRLIDWQDTLRDALYASRDSTRTPGGLAFALLLVMAYGFLHALGPGHGKIFISSYFLVSEARLKKAVLGGALVGMLHAVSGFLLVLILHFLLRGRISKEGEDAQAVIETVSFIVLFLMGCFLLWKSVRNTGEHKHEASTFWGLVISIGAVPCPGAVMISVFGLMIVRSFWVASLLILGIGVGMSAAISLFALLPGLLKRIPGADSTRLWRGFSIAGALAIVLFSATLLFTRM